MGNLSVCVCGGSPPFSSLGDDLAEPFPCSTTLPWSCGQPRLWYRVLGEELLVAAFEDVHLRVVEAGVVVGGPVSFPDETAPGTSGSVGVRAGHTAGWTSGYLFPAPTPLRALGNCKEFKYRHVSQKNT